MAAFSKTDPATVPTVLPMTSTTPMTRTASFHARPGHGGALAERLLHAASLVAEAPGCELRLVHRGTTGATAAEEIDLALSGTGRITVGDNAFELQPPTAVRVAPGSTRELEAAAQGLEVLAFGSHSSGDGEMVADRQRA